MIRGTGLPLPKDDATVQPAGINQGINAEAFSNAQAWGQIANAGRQLREIGIDRIERAVHKKNVGYLADQENEIARKRIDLHNQFRKDPAAFDKAWTAYSDGKLSETEPWAVPQVKARLGQEGNSAYASLLNDKAQNDEALDRRRVRTLADQSASDVIGAAMVGTLSGPDGQAKVAKLQAVLDTAVSSDFMSQDEADLAMLETTSRAGAESVIKTIGDSYKANRAKGLEAGDLALKEAEEGLLRNTDERLRGLNEEQRYGYYHKATAEIRALEAERRQDLGIARQAKADAEMALTNGIRVSPDTVSDIVQQLEAAGGHADAARLRASASRFDQLAAYGRQPLEQQVQQYQMFSVMAGSDDGLNFLRGEEGFTPTAKWDYRQNSNGFGTRALFPGETISREEAERRLKTEAGVVEKYIDENVKVPLTPGQRKALVSFGFNLGTDDIGKLLDDINAGNFERVSQRMLSFNQAGGQVLSGLVARRQREADMFAGKEVTPNPLAVVGPGVDHKLLAGMQREMSAETKERWTKVKAQLDDGQRPAPAELNTLIQAATIGGDHDLLDEIGERLDRLDASKIAGQTSLATQQGAAAELNAAGSAGQLTAAQSAWKRDLEKVTADTEKKLADDPVSLGAERFPERFAQPPALDFSNPDAVKQGVAARLNVAGFVAQNYGKRDIPLFGPADRTAIASAIAAPEVQQQGAANGAIMSPQPSQSSVALSTLATLPDDYLFPTLESKEIKTAVNGALRTTDPVKYLATMQAVDQLWARAPEDTARLIGADGVKGLQDWQAKLRYHTPEQLADDLRRRDDPQYKERLKTVETEARRVFRDAGYTISSVNSALDPGWFITGPDEPTDPRTRDMAIADFEMLFTERYMETLDKGTAETQAVERMRLKWGRSEVNGGKLMLHAPEKVYAPVNGSYDWMKTQIVDDLTKHLGFMPDDYSLVSDQGTERDLAANRAPGYLLSYTRNGVHDMVRGPDGRPLRFAFDRLAPAQNARTNFEQQRQNLFKQPAPTINLGGMVR